MSIFGAKPAQSAFGQSTTNAFGQPIANANQPQQSSILSRPGGFGQSTNTGFGQPTNTGFGQSANTGFGQSANTGFGQSANTGFGQSANTGFGQSMTNAGLGQSTNVGFGQSTNAGLGQSTNVGFGQSTNAGLGQSTTVGFGQNFGQSSLAQPNPPQQQGNSIWQPMTMAPHQKPVPDQMQALYEKWRPDHPSTAFKTYLYNKVDEASVPHFGPLPHEDPREWEEALQKKPAANYIPVLCRGFSGITGRLVLQRRAIAQYNTRLHEINGCLETILSRHDLEHSVRALNARRRHDALRKRCLALAARVQAMRNRGYTLSSDEDDLRAKLQALDRAAQDPALTSRLEELWSRLILLREYAEGMKVELDKQTVDERQVLTDEVAAKIKKVLEDYDKQLQHLKREIGQIQKDLNEWEKEHQPAAAPK